MSKQNRASAVWPAEAGYVRRTWAPGTVVQAPGAPPVHLLLVTEWLDSVSLHLSWPWLHGDVHCSLRQAYQLTDQDGHPCPLLDSRVMPLVGRMNEVTYFDTRALGGPQTLSLRLRAQLATPVPIPFGGDGSPARP